MIVSKDTSSLEERVYGELEEAILSGELKSGEALTELSPFRRSSASAERLSAAQVIALRRRDSSQ